MKPQVNLFVFTVLLLVVFTTAIEAKSTKSTGKSKVKPHGHKKSVSNNTDSTKNAIKAEKKRQFITRPRIRYFGNRPYIWMKPSPLTQRTIVTTHIPRPPLALPYSTRIMKLLANRYPSSPLGRRGMSPGYPEYGGLGQESPYSPHMEDFHGYGHEEASEDPHGFSDEDNPGMNVYLFRDY